MKAQFALLGSATAVLLLNSSVVMADSAKILNADNGHYYQRIDVERTWSEAKITCESFGSHLVTITSILENNFIYSKLHQDYQELWLGGTKESGSWAWITGEPFKYNFWRSGESQKSGYIFTYSISPDWIVGSNSRTSAYVCEWEPKTYTSVLSLPDLNGNSSPESAGLFIDTKTFTHTVTIKDTSTQATLKTIIFDTNNKVAPLDMAKVSDMDGNGAPEIAVMYWTKKSGAIGPMIGLMIKDAITGKASRVAPITLFSLQYKAISLTSTQDITGDGINELEVLVMKYKDSKVSSQIIDPVTGTVVKTVDF